MDIRCRHFDAMSSEEWIRFISNNAFSKEELCWIYCCGLIWHDLLTDQENLPVVTRAMLDNGMDPNQLITDKFPDKDPKENFYHIPLISATRIDDASSAAESLKILLERGGDPNTEYDFWSHENVFGFYVDDESINAPDLDGGLFYGLILCAAYGGKYLNGYTPFTMMIDAPISIFKEYDRYWYEYEKHDNYSSTLFFIEKKTGRRIAKFR